MEKTETHALVKFRHFSLPSGVFIPSSSSLRRPAYGSTTSSGNTSDRCAKISSSSLRQLSAYAQRDNAETAHLVSLRLRGGTVLSKFQYVYKSPFRRLRNARKMNRRKYLSMLDGYNGEPKADRVVVESHKPTRRSDTSTHCFSI